MTAWASTRWGSRCCAEVSFRAAPPGAAFVFVVLRVGCDKPLSLSLETAIFLFVAGVLGGALNAVAGGGSFVAFPALLFTGVPPIPANATNTVALWTRG